MKKIVYIALTGVLAATTSCVNLDIMSKSSVLTANMWQTEEQIDAGVAACYSVFYGGDTFDSPIVEPKVSFVRTEMMGFQSLENAHRYFATTSAWTANDGWLSTEWKYLYEGVHTCNDAIHHLKDTKVVTGAKRARLLAECKFLRAFYYTRLNMLWDGVPLYLEPVKASECNKGRSTPEDVWKAVLQDLQDVIDEPNVADNTLSENYGRPSKGAAYALKGKVYMWLKQYGQAIDCFNKVAECGYGLWIGRYIDFYTEANEKSREMIFPIQYLPVDGYCDTHTQLYFGSRSTSASFNFIVPAARFVDYYKNADGSDFAWSQYFPDWDKLDPSEREVFFVRDGMNSNKSSDFANQKTSLISRIGQAVWDKYYLDNGNETRLKAVWDNRDPRLKQTIYTFGNTYQTCALMGGESSAKTFRWPYIVAGNTNEAGDLWADSRTWCTYLYRKFVIENEPSLIRNQIGRDWPAIHYTDIYLMLAEAYNETGGTEKAIKIVNEVRDRAGMPKLVLGGNGANGVANKDDMRERIRYERRVELCGEGVDYFDEVRWGTLKEMKFGSDDRHYYPQPWGVKGWNVEYFRCNGWPMAIPMAECQRNNNLVPTDGWQY